MKRAWVPIDLNEKSLAYFWAKVALPDENGCMLWTGRLSREGYGSFARRNKLPLKAHRVSLWLAEGDAPTGRELATHACRNRHCVAPAHLSWGSHQKNMQDMVVRDQTVAHGKRNGQAKLLPEQVVEIQARYAAGDVLQRELAEAYGVSRQTVGLIVNGKRWCRVAPIREKAGAA